MEFILRLIKLKPPADATIFQWKFFEQTRKKSGLQIRQGAFDTTKLKIGKGNDENVNEKLSDYSLVICGEGFHLTY